MPSESVISARAERIALLREQVKRFHIALIRAEITQKQFCEQAKINHNIFNQAVNGWRTMRPDYQAAVDAFVDADMEEQRAEWTKRLKRK